MFPRAALLSLCFAAVAFGQQAGTLTAETHPSLPAQKCTKSGGCTTVNTKIVLDSNWRWLHSTSSATNCYTGNQWNAQLVRTFRLRILRIGLTNEMKSARMLPHVLPIVLSTAPVSSLLAPCALEIDRTS
jgi:hypothetical protein